MPSITYVLPPDVARFKRNGPQFFIRDGFFPAGEVTISKIVTAWLSGRGGCAACCVWISGTDYYFDALEAGITTPQLDEYRRILADDITLQPAPKTAL